MRNKCFQLITLVVLGLFIAQSVLAQDIPGPQITDKVGIDQKLGQQIPLDLTFRDETGQEHRLGDYFGKRPVVLALVYYQCPGLCTLTLNGMARSFKPLKFDIGTEYYVVTVSFDPRETSKLAADKKMGYVAEYGRPGADVGWHFLTGDEDQIRQLTQAVGFRYTFDEKSQQYAHASAIMVLTPGGKISKYFYGLEYSSNDLRLGLMEASQEKIGSLADRIMLLCFAYDPASHKYSLRILMLLRVLGAVTVLGIGSYVIHATRKSRQLAAAAAASGANDASGKSTTKTDGR